MLENLKKFYNHQDKIIFFAVFSSLLIAFFQTTIWAVTFKLLPRQVPLYYSLPWGDKQLVLKSQLIIPSAVVLLITLVNLAISWPLHISQLNLKRIINLSSAILSLIILITFLKIVLIFI